MNIIYQKFKIVDNITFFEYGFINKNIIILFYPIKNRVQNGLLIKMTISPLKV